jgi:hypothetical protein
LKDHHTIKKDPLQNLLEVVSHATASSVNSFVIVYLYRGIAHTIKHMLLLNNVLQNLTAPKFPCFVSVIQQPPPERPHLSCLPARDTD